MSWAFSGGRRDAASQHFRALLLLLAAAGLAASGCHQSADAAQSISIKESIAPQPVRTGSETVTLRLADAAGRPLAHAHIQIEGDMEHPGMEPVFSGAIEAEPGSYHAPLVFTMGGDWVVLAHITLADGHKIERQWEVKGVESR